MYRKSVSVTTCIPNRKVVILMQEWYSLVDHIKDAVDRLAKRGSMSQLLTSTMENATTNPTDAQKLAMATEISQVEKDVFG